MPVLVALPPVTTPRGITAATAIFARPAAAPFLRLFLVGSRQLTSEALSESSSSPTGTRTDARCPFAVRNFAASAADFGSLIIFTFVCVRSGHQQEWQHEAPHDSASTLCVFFFVFRFSFSFLLLFIFFFQGTRP